MASPSASGDPAEFLISPRTTAKIAAPLEQIRLSRSRWWAVALFACVSAMQNIVWICFNIIIGPTVTYYSLPSANPVNLLVGVGALVFCPFVCLSTVLLDKLGLRPVVVLGTAFVAVGASVRLLSLLGRGWAWVVLGQVLNGIAGPVVMAAPTMLASTFFPVQERTTAVAIAWLAQPVGLALGFLVGPSVVSEASDLPALLWAEAGIGVGLFVLVLVTFPATPAHAPSRSAQVERSSMTWAKIRETVRLVMRPSYLALVCAWGISGGVFTGWQALLDLFLDLELGIFTSDQVGWLGFAANVAGGFGALLFGFLVDRFGMRLKRSVIVLFAMTTASLVALICILLFVPAAHGHHHASNQTPAPAPAPAPAPSPTPSPAGNNTDSMMMMGASAEALALQAAQKAVAASTTTGAPPLLWWTTMFVCIICGASSTAVGAVAMEWAVDLTFPLSEAVSAGILTFVFNLFVGIFAFLGDVLTGWTITYITLGVLVVSTITLIFVKDEGRREIIDKAQEEEQDEEQDEEEVGGRRGMGREQRQALTGADEFSLASS